MKKTVLLTALGIIAFTGFSQDTATEKFSFSVQQAIDYALANQNNIKNLMLDEEIAHQKVNEMVGRGLPQINSSIDTRDFLKIPTSVIPAAAFGGPPGAFKAVQFGTKYQTSAGLDGSQLLFSGDYFLGLQASKMFVELYTKSTQLTKIETAANVSKAYYMSLITEERIALMGANNIRIKTALDGTRGLYLAGMAEKIDVDRLDVIYNNQLVETEKLGRMSEVFMYMLKFQMGMNNSASLTLTDKLADLKLDVGNNVSAEKFEYSKRAEFSLLETQLKLAQLDLKRNKLSFLPTAVAYGSLSANAFRNSYNFFNPNLGWYPTALVGAKISMPIFSGLQNHAKIQQAKMSMQKTENSMESMKQYIDLSIVSSMTSLKNAAASLENQKKNIVIAEDVYRISKIKYEQGVGSFIELLTAETSLKESQTNYFSALVDALVAKIEYDKANGSIGGVK